MLSALTYGDRSTLMDKPLRAWVQEQSGFDQGITPSPRGPSAGTIGVMDQNPQYRSPQSGHPDNAPRAPQPSYYQAPQYAARPAAGGPNPYAPPSSLGPANPQFTSPPPPTLNNTVSFIALGAMLVAAAIGLGKGSGLGLLVGVGLCALIAGSTLAYAALRGLRAGWFLPVSIVGAVMAIPVTLWGIGTQEQDYYVDPGLGFSSSGSYLDETFDDWDDWDDVVDFEAWADTEVVALDPDESDIFTQDTVGVLDLTKLGTEADGIAYSLDVDDSLVTVLLRPDQIPEISTSSLVESLITVASEDRSLIPSPLVIFSGSRGDGPLISDVVADALGSKAKKAQTIEFDISAFDSSIEFRYVTTDSTDSTDAGSTGSKQTDKSPDDQANKDESTSEDGE